MDTQTYSAEQEFAWAPRRQLSLAQVRRRSGMVKILRMLFVACAAIAIGLLAGHIVANAIAGASGGRKAFQSDEIVTMVNPRFTGRDASGETYVIIADSAQRRRADDDVIDLVNPKLVDRFGSTVTAPEGVFDQSRETLDLFRDVRVVDNAGYQFRTTSARLHVVDSRVEGLEPLQGSGPLGDIRSDTYEILENGDVFHFKGNVEMLINPQEDTPNPPPDGAPMDGNDG